MRLIVAGGRDFTDYHKALEVVNTYVRDRFPLKSFEIVSGGARGADSLGERISREVFKKPAKMFPVTKEDWEWYGGSAGNRRNGMMAEYATDLVAFWDGESTGTGDMIQQAREHRLGVKVVRYKKR